MAAAQDASRAPPPLEAFFGPSNLPEAALSPSGDKLAIVSHKSGTRRMLMVLDLNNRGKTIGILELRDADVQDVHWVNDRRLVFFAGFGGDGDPKEYGRPGLYSINADGSGLLQLTIRRQYRRSELQLADEEQARKEAGFPMVEAPSRLLKVPVPKEGQANEEVLMAEVKERDHQVPFWLNVRTREQRADNFGLDAPILRLLTDPYGQPRVAVVEERLKAKALRRLPDTGEWVPLAAAPDGELMPMEPGNDEALMPSIVAIDGRGILYSTRLESSSGYSALSKLDFQGGTSSSTTLVNLPDFDFAGSVITDTGDMDAAGFRVNHARETTVWRAQAMRAFQAAVDKMLPDMVSRIDCRRCGTPGMVALIRSYGDREPGRLRVYRAGAERAEERWLDLGPVRTAIDPSRMASVKLQRIQARDGRDLPVWITRPAGSTGPLPAVVLVHGGPWARGGTWDWRPQQQFLASRGYLVIEPEMRGSAGYGQAHLEAGFKQFGQAMQDDVADALLWARQAGLADERACIMGASYGGYSALMGLVRHPDLYRCAVASLAPADLDLLVEGSFWVDDDYAAAREKVIPERLADPKKDASMITANSPMKQAARIKAPVLLAYGELDKRVPLKHGERMRDALKQAGNPPEWVTYREGHGFQALPNQLNYYARVEAFLAKHLAPH